MKSRLLSRKVIIIVISLLIVVAAGVYTWQSLSAWKGYEARLTKEQSEFQSLKNTALNGKTTDDRLKALRQLDDKVKARKTLCDMNVLFAWQAAVIPPIKDGVTKCKQAVKRLDAISVPLSGLRVYLDVATKVQSAVGALKLGGSLNEQNWNDLGLKRAQKLQSELKSISANGDAKELKDQAVELSDSLVAKWQTLIKANGDKNKLAYLAAAAELAKAYTDFASLADSADKVIAQKVNELSKAAASL